uniref:Phosphoprotein membrane anchor with glycosphingolipid microdomains 1 n=1 Tax=Sinocyclocheilus anshuiensis TaxID=1608454 RepID=A0A671QWG9_9TELE
VCSQSVESHGTDLAVSSSHNGPLTSGTGNILTDTTDTSPQPSEDMLSSQSEIRSSKYHQDRELPSIPPTDTLKAAIDAQVPSGEGTYEVVKDSASRDVSVEDCLYETVKELKDIGLPNGTLSPEEPPAPLLNGHPSPATQDHTMLPNGVEYASVNLSKKSRYSTDMEARHSAAIVNFEEPDDENPPPVPDKVLDENDNQQIPNGQVGLPNSLLIKVLLLSSAPSHTVIRIIISETNQKELHQHSPVPAKLRDCKRTTLCFQFNYNLLGYVLWLTVIHMCACSIQMNLSVEESRLAAVAPALNVCTRCEHPLQLHITVTSRGRSAPPLFITASCTLALSISLSFALMFALSPFVVLI